MESILLVAAETDTSGIGDWLWTRLKGAGFKVWWGEYDLRAGTVVAAGLEDAIAEHTAILLLVNRETIESRWSEFQSDLALSVRKRIVPIVIDDSAWPARFRTGRAIALHGPNDWQALHRLVNHLGGEAIPRLVNLSGHPGVRVINGLMLAETPLQNIDLADVDGVTRYGTEMARFALPFIRQFRAGIVLPGLGPAAGVTLAYLLGVENGLPPIYASHKDEQNRFQIDGSKPIHLQAIRDSGFAARAQIHE